MALENELTEATAFTSTDFVRIVKDLGGGEFGSQIIGRAALWQYLMALPDGTMLNGKLAPTVASNNLTLALKTQADADPSAGDPVLIKINGTWRVCSAALSVTKAAATNWCNAGSAELATKEIDYFAYLIWNTTPATDIVDLGFARIPYGRVYSDFSGASTNEKYLAQANGSAPTSTDGVVVIGRFAATLSAGAGYTWSVPTYTSANLVQRPIYQTRQLSWTPAITYNGGTTDPTSNTVDTAKYSINYTVFQILIQSTLVRGSGNRGFTNFTLPFTLNGLTPFNCIESVTAAGLHYPTGAYSNGNAIAVKTTMANDGVYYLAGSTQLIL